MDNYIFCNKIT